MASGGKRAGSGRPKREDDHCSLQIRVPVKYRDLIKQMVNQKLKQLKDHGNSI